MRTDLGNQVFSIVRQHCGAAAAVSSPQICRELGWDPTARERLVRQLIADEAPFWDGLPICSIPGRGYFVPESIEELATYHNWLSALAERAKNKVHYFRDHCRKAGINLKALSSAA